MSDLNVTLRLSSDNRELKADVQDSRAEIASIGASAEQSADRVTTASSDSARAIGAIKTAAALAAAAVAGISAADFAKSLVSEQEQVQRNMLRTGAIIKATGETAGFTSDELYDQAKALARATLQSTEGVERGQQILLTFRSVSGDTFTRATELAADLATVTGQDLTGALTQLGKALEDPTEGVNALRRSGVSFSDAQRDMIKSLVDTGKQVEAQKIVLDELAREYGGVARAEAMGLAGAQDTLGQAIQEVKIRIADQLELSDRLAAAINRVSAAIDDIDADDIADGLDAIKVAGTAVAVVLAARLLVALQAVIANMVAAEVEAIKYQAVLARMAGISGTAAAAQLALAQAARAGSVAMAFIGGPTGAALLAAAGIYYLATRSNETEKATQQLTDQLHDLKAGLQDLNKTALDVKLDGVRAQLSDVDVQISQLQKKLDQASAGPAGNGTGANSVFLGTAGVSDRIRQQLGDLQDQRKVLADTEAELVSQMILANDAASDGVNSEKDRGQTLDDNADRLKRIQVLQRSIALFKAGASFDDAGFQAQYEAADSLDKRLADLTKTWNGLRDVQSVRDSIASLEAENALLAEGNSLEKARQILKLQNQGADDDQIQQLLKLADAQDTLVKAQKNAEQTEKNNQERADNNRKQIEESIKALKEQAQALTTGTSAEKAQALARLKSIGALASQIDEYSRFYDTVQGLQGLLAQGFTTDGVSFEDAFGLGAVFEDLDKLESRLKDIGASGADAVQQIVDASRQFASAAALSGNQAFGAYAQGAASALSAIQSMTTQGSDSYRRLGLAIAALNAISAVQAILNQAAGDPYTAFERMASMAAVVASLGIQVGGLVNGGGSGSVKVGSGSLSEGSGTVLGDPTAQSESIANSLDALEDYAEDDLGYSAQQLRALRTIDSSISSLASALAQQLGITGTTTPISVNEYSKSNFAGIANLFSDGIISDTLDTVSLGFVTDIAGALISGLSKTSVSVRDYGLAFDAGQTVGDILSSGLIQGAYYAVVHKRTSSFGITTSSSTSTETEALDAALSSSIADVLSGLADSVISAAEVFGVSVTDAENQINSLTLNIDQISLEGLTSDEITEQLEAVFSAIGDTFAETVLPAISQFQEVGEGAYETLIRVASETTIVSSNLEALGFSLDTLSGLDLATVAENLIDLAGSLDDLTDELSSYYSAFYSESEQFDLLSQSLSASLADLGYSLPGTRDGFRELVDSLDITTESGQETFAALLSLSDAADSYYSYLEDAADDYAEAADSLQDFRDSISALVQETSGTSLTALRAQFANASALANAGSLEGIDSLIDIGGSLADASLAQASDKTEYLRDLARIQIAASQAESTATAVSADAIAAEQLEELYEQTDLLESIEEALTDDDLDAVAVATGTTASAAGTTVVTVSTTSADATEVKADLDTIIGYLYQLVVYAGKTASSTRKLEDWDYDGLPPERTAS